MSKRQLNIIYFVDSSRTRTIKLPLGRVIFVLLLIASVVTWSVGSAVLLNAAYQERADLSKKLRTALATVFDYETRYDGVYDIAYPSDKLAPAVAAKSASKPVTPPVAAALAKIPQDEPSATAQQADAAAADGEGLTDQPVVTPPRVAVARPVPQARDLPGSLEAKAKVDKAAKAAAATVEEKTSPAADGDAKATPIVVGNPVIENGHGALQVKFDLTNKSPGRAEGYIWAVAAFKNAAGETTFIADPPNIGVKADGEVADVSKSSNFGIRKFKKMSFSFPVKKEFVGTFTGIKIGVTDKAGTNRTTYNVPIEIKVGQAEVPTEGTNR